MNDIVALPRVYLIHFFVTRDRNLWTLKVREREQKIVRLNLDTERKQTVYYVNENNNRKSILLNAFIAANISHDLAHITKWKC